MRRFELDETPECTARYNIAPGQPILAVRADAQGARRADALLWGLGRAGGPRHINARSETASSKPAFRAAFRARRCIVPASGFYEWADLGGSKHPYWIARPDASPFGIAALWDPAGDEGAPECCALLTTEANARLAPLHPRMPAILAPAEHAAWLDPERDDAALAELLRPLADDALGYHPVAPRVNRVEVDDPSCVEAVAEPPRQTSLF